jgi:hypothetical protein
MVEKVGAAWVAAVAKRNIQATFLARERKTDR